MFTMPGLETVLIFLNVSLHLPTVSMFRPVGVMVHMWKSVQPVVVSSLLLLYGSQEWDSSHQLLVASILNCRAIVCPLSSFSSVVL